MSLRKSGIAFWRWLSACVVLLTFGLLASGIALFAMVIAGLLAAAWYVFGWLGGVLFAIRAKLKPDTSDFFRWRDIFSWRFIQVYGIKGPLFLGESVMLIFTETFGDVINRGITPEEQKLLDRQ